MTRSTKSLITILAAVGAMAATAVPAMGEGYSSPSSIVGPVPSTNASSSAPVTDHGYSSPAALVGDGSTGSSEPAQSTFSGNTPAAILGADGIPEPSPQLVSSDPSDGFDWGDAAIGSAVGLGLAALLGTALVTSRRRRGATVQPSV
jgi:hypothetical protein